MYQEYSSPVLGEFKGMDNKNMAYGEHSEARKTQSFQELLIMHRPEHLSKKLKLKGLTRLTEGDSLVPEDSIPLTNESCSPRATGTPSFVAAPTSLSEYFHPPPAVNSSLGYLERLRMSHQKVIEYRPMDNLHISEHEESYSSALLQHKASRHPSRAASQYHSPLLPDAPLEPDLLRMDSNTPSYEDRLAGEPESSIAEVQGQRLDFGVPEIPDTIDAPADAPLLTFQKQSVSSGCFIFPAHNQLPSPAMQSPNSPSPPARSPEAFSQSQERFSSKGEYLKSDSTKAQDQHLDSPEPLVSGSLQLEVLKKNRVATRVREGTDHRPSFHQETLLKLSLQNEILIKQNEKLKAQLCHHELTTEENAFLKQKVALLSRTLKLLRRSQTHSSHGLPKKDDIGAVDLLQKHFRARLSNEPRTVGKGLTALGRSRSALALISDRPVSRTSSHAVQPTEKLCSTSERLQAASSPHNSLIQGMSQATSPRNTVPVDSERLGHYFTTTGPLKPARKADHEVLQTSSGAVSYHNDRFSKRLEARLRRHQLELNNLLNVQPISSPAISTRHQGTKIIAWPTSAGCPRSQNPEEGCRFQKQPIKELLAAATTHPANHFGLRGFQGQSNRKNVSLHGLSTTNPQISASRQAFAYTTSSPQQNRNQSLASQTKPSVGQSTSKSSVCRTQPALRHSSPRLAQIEMQQLLDGTKQTVRGISSICSAGTRSTLLQLIKSRGTRVVEVNPTPKDATPKEPLNSSTNPRFHSALLRRSQLLGLSK